MAIRDIENRPQPALRLVQPNEAPSSVVKLFPHRVDTRNSVERALRGARIAGEVIGSFLSERVEGVLDKVVPTRGFTTVNGYSTEDFSISRF
jgi:hypothetical protein